MGWTPKYSCFEQGHVLFYNAHSFLDYSKKWQDAWWIEYGSGHALFKVWLQHFGWIEENNENFKIATAPAIIQTQQLQI